MTRNIENNKADLSKMLTGILNSKTFKKETQICAAKALYFIKTIDKQHNEMKNFSSKNENGANDIKILRINIYIKQLEKKLNKEISNLENLNNSETDASESSNYTINN